MSDHDRYGNVLTAPEPAAVSTYDQAVDALVRFADDVGERWEATVTDWPGFAMGQIGRAYLCCLSSEQGDAARARDILTLVGGPERLTAREQLHLRAAAAYAAGDLHGAREILARLSVAHPRDVLALVVGHQLDFFCGDAWALRDRIGRTLLSWRGDDPMLGFVLGMHAFGLEECGQYERAEDVGQQALAHNRDDVWAIHAVVHTYEMRGRVDQGLAFMDGRRDDWARGNFFVVHNAWHEALFRLEAGDVDGALAVYDTAIHHDGSGPVALELLDAASLLWRLHLDGVELPTRWPPLAQAWAAALREPWYVFNDVHAVMAHVAAGDLESARRIEARLAAYAGEDHAAEANLPMTVEVGLPVTSALVAFAEGRYDDTIALLHPVRGRLARFGGSHAQRDVFARTLLEAAFRAGALDLARALISERLAVNPDSRFARRQLERAG